MSFHNTSVTSPFHKAFNLMGARCPMFEHSNPTEVIMDLMGEGERVTKVIGDDVQHIMSLTKDGSTLKFKCSTKQAQQKLHDFLLTEENMKTVSINDDEVHVTWIGGPDEIPEKLADRTQEDFHDGASAFVFGIFETLGVKTHW